MYVDSHVRVETGRGVRGGQARLLELLQAGKGQVSSSRLAAHWCLTGPYSLCPFTGKDLEHMGMRPYVCMY